MRVKQFHRAVVCLPFIIAYIKIMITIIVKISLN